LYEASAYDGTEKGGKYMVDKQKKDKKTYSQEYVESAVEMVQRSGKPAAEVARELGLPEWKVGAWVRQARKRSEAGPASASLQEENKRLKRELAQAREENEILKKAATYFARHQQ
jgi:transposase